MFFLLLVNSGKRCYLLIRRKTQKEDQENTKMVV